MVETVTPYEQHFDTEATDEQLGRQLYDWCFEMLGETNERWPSPTATGERKVGIGRDSKFSPLLFVIHRSDFPANDGSKRYASASFTLYENGRVSEFNAFKYPPGEEPEARDLLEVLIDELQNEQPRY